ncbi:MAG TPA: phosphodiester glycosidase family protein [Candidatus Limnocylindria bacterium]
MKIAIALLLLIGTLMSTAAARPAAALTCTASVGPGIPPPASVPAGIPGFHAAWYGQSGYPTLCPGLRSTATVAYSNSGSLGWVQGRMGESAYLGTWGPEPGQDRASILGGDGTSGSPNTGWPNYDRIAVQPAAYVGPGQVAWFQFTIQAPTTPGYYRLYLRPLIEGATWMEDYGVFWLVTVLNADGTRPPAPPAVSSPIGHSVLSVATARGTFTAHVIKEPLASVTVKTLTANATDCTSDCPVKPLERYVTEAGGFAGMHGTYLCPPDYSWCAGKVNSYEYAVFNTDLRKWLNAWALVSPTNGLATFVGGTPRFYRHTYSYDRSPVTAAISNFPLLLQNGAVVDSEAEQTAAQKARGMKGSIGVDGQYVYLALVSNASVTESAYVLQALGVRDALNLDGGGTSAMWFGGSYTVGPGRLLPNAVVLTSR